MTTMRTKLAQTLGFAHLLGLGARAEDEDGRAKRARRAEDDERDDDEKKGKRAEEGDDEDDKDEKKVSRRAEEEDDEKKGKRAEEGDDEDDKDKKEGRRAKSKADDEDLDDEDDSDDEMRGNSASAKARRRERARCAAIFGCAAAGVRPDVAASLAFTTNMSRSEAVSVLTAAAAGGSARRTASLGDRMNSAEFHNVTGDGGVSAPSGRSKVANAIIAAGEKARGK